MQTYEIALKEYGVTEIPGTAHNPRILTYVKEAGFTEMNDETAWCSIFMNWVAKKCGLERSKKENARSWLQVGENVTTPQLGDVVVFWRVSPTSWEGHVSIFISLSEDKKFINVLGGNQDNHVCIKAYPVSQLLGYRRLRAAI